MFELKGYKIAGRSHHVMHRVASAAPGVMAAARARNTAPQPLGIGGAVGHSAPTIHSTKEGTRLKAAETNVKVRITRPRPARSTKQPQY